MSTRSATSPPSKRIKLEPNSPVPANEKLGESKNQGEDLPDVSEEDLDHQCSICLQPIVDRTVLPTCSHEFCFDCLLLWSGVWAYNFWIRERDGIFVQSNLGDVHYAPNLLVDT